MKKYYVVLWLICAAIASWAGYGFWFGPKEGTNTVDSTGASTTTTVQPYKSQALAIWLIFSAAGWYFFLNRRK